MFLSVETAVLIHKIRTSISISNAITKATTSLAFPHITTSTREFPNLDLNHTQTRNAALACAFPPDKQHICLPAMEAAHVFHFEHGVIYLTETCTAIH